MIRSAAGQPLGTLCILDERTGLPGQRLFRDELAQACARARTTGDVCGVVRVRLENMRRINARCGRDFGHVMLETLAHRLRRLLPEGTILGRIRGAEFAFVVPPVWGSCPVHGRLPGLPLRSGARLPAGKTDADGRLRSLLRDGES